MPDTKDTILQKINTGSAQEVAIPSATSILDKIKEGQAQALSEGPGDPAKKKDGIAPSVLSPRPTPLASDGAEEDLLSKGTFGLIKGLSSSVQGVAPYTAVAGPEAERIVADKLLAGGATERQVRTGLGVFRNTTDPVSALATASLYDAKTKQFREQQKAATAQGMETSGALDRLMANAIPADQIEGPAPVAPTELEQAAARSQRPVQDVLTVNPRLAESAEVSEYKDAEVEEKAVAAERPTYFQTGSVGDLYRQENALAEQFLGQKLPSDLLNAREQKAKEMDMAVNLMDQLKPEDQASFISDLTKAIEDGQTEVENADDPEFGINKEQALVQLNYLKELQNYAQQKYDRYSQPVIDNFIRGYVKQIQQGHLNGEYLPNFEFRPLDNIQGIKEPFTATPDTEFKPEQQDRIRDDIRTFIANSPQGAYLSSRDENFLVKEILNTYQVQGKLQSDLINKFETEGDLTPEQRAVFRAGNILAGVGDDWADVGNQVADYRKQLVASNPSYSDPNPQQAVELDAALSKYQKQLVTQKIIDLESSLGGSSMKDMTPEQINEVLRKYNSFINEPNENGRTRFQQATDNLQDETQRINAEKYAGQNWAEKGADHFINGLDNVMVMMGNALYASGAKGLGSHIRDPYLAERMDAKAYKTPTISWADVSKGNANPLYYILEQAGEQLPFTLFGGAAAKVGGTLLGNFGSGLLGRQLSSSTIKTLAGASAALSETYLNAGDSYYQMAIERGIEPEKAKEFAMQQFSKEILLNLVTDRIEYAPFYSEYKGLIKPGLRKAATNIAGTIAGQTAVQGGQEVAQGYLQQETLAKAEGNQPLTIGEYIATPEAKEDFFGAFAGSMPQSLSASVSEAYNNQQNWRKLSESSLQIQPNAFKGILDAMIIEGRPDRATAMLNSFLEDAQRIATDPSETKERRSEAVQSVRSITGDIEYVNSYWKEATKFAQSENKPLNQFDAKEKYGLQLIAASDAMLKGIPQVHAEKSGVDLANEKKANSLREAGINLLNGEGAVYELQDSNGRSIFTNGEKLARLVQQPEFTQMVADGVITNVNVQGDPTVEQIVKDVTAGVEFKDVSTSNDPIITPAKAQDAIINEITQPQNIENATQISEPLQVPREGVPVQEQNSVGEYQGVVSSEPVEEQVGTAQPRPDSIDSDVSRSEGEEAKLATERSLADIAISLSGGVRQYDSSNMNRIISENNQLPSAKKQALRKVSNAVKAISGISPNMKVIVANSEDAFVKLYTQANNRDESGENITVTANGFYNPVENTIVLNTAEDGFDASTVFHENIHPVISNIAAKNPQLVDTMFEELTADPDLNDTFVRKYAARYGTRQDRAVREEAIVEYLAQQSANRSFTQKIGDWINRVLQRLGLSRNQVAQLDLNNYDGIRSMATSLANALQRGRQLDITVPQANTPEILSASEDQEQDDDTFFDPYSFTDLKVPVSSNMSVPDYLESALKEANIDYTKSIADTGSQYYTLHDQNGDSLKVRYSNHQKGSNGRFMERQTDANIVYDDSWEMADVLENLQSHLMGRYLLQNEKPSNEKSKIRLQLSGLTKSQKQAAKQAAAAKQIDLDNAIQLQQDLLTGAVNIGNRSAEDVMRDINEKIRNLSEEIADLTSQSQFTVAEQTLKDRVKQKVIDRYARLLDYKKGLQEAGYDFDVSNDFYAGADLWRPRAYERIKALASEIGFDKFRPNSLFGQMNKAGINFNEFGEYLYALHAPERNAYNREMSQLKVDAAIEELLTERENAENDFQRADIDLQIEDIRQGRNKDFMVIEDGSGMTDQEAQEVMDELNADPQKKAEFEKFEQKFRQTVVEPILATKLKYGLIDEAEFDALANGRYKKYVPLKVNESFFTGDDQFKDAVLFPQKNMRINKGIFKSKGAGYIRSQSRNNPIVQSVIDLQDDIMKGEANRYRAQIAQSVKDNPNKKLWSIQTARYDYRKGPDGKQIPVAEIGVPKNGIEFYDKGKKKYIVIEEGPLLDAIKETNVTAAVPVLSHINSWMRNINTVYNPEFWMTNLIRDIQEAGLALGREDIKGLTRKFLSNIKNRKLYQGIFQKEGGDSSSEMGQWAQRYADNGGEFSGYSMNSQEEMFKNVENAYNKYSKTGAVAHGKRLASKLGEYWNRTASTVELASRVSAFKALVESGVPEYKAAEIARNLTVNFDKKGEWGSTINSLYLFANAGIQGSTNLMYGMLTKRRYLAIAAGVATLGALEGIYNDNMSDCEKPEDCYDSISQDTKNKNIIIKNPTGKGFLKIPIPYGWSFFHALGVNGAQAARKRKSHGEAVVGSLQSFIDSFNPIATDDLLQSLAPTAFDPVVQLATNTSWTGGKIKPEQIYKAKPESQLAFTNTSGAARNLAEFLNIKTGGNEKIRGKIDVSPAILDYLFDTGTGGVGRSILGIGGLFTGRVTEQGVKAVPFLRKFYDAPRRLVDMNNLYDMKDEAPRVKFTPYELKRFDENVERAYRAGEIDKKQRKEFKDLMHKTQSAAYAKFYEDRLSQLMIKITHERFPDKEVYESKVSAAKRKATEYAQKKTRVERGD